MTIKSQIVEMIDFIPDRELPIILEVVKRFIPSDADDCMTEDDVNAHECAVQEYRNGETISHSEINWE
jgi:hypothetical protein